MARWTIMGWYWPSSSGDKIYCPVDHHKTRTFTGFVEVSEDGIFKGITTDSFGSADIVGSIYGSKLEFSKKYRESAVGRGGAKGEISYLLQTAKIKIKNKEIDTGWRGVYGGKNAHGNAACMLYPLPL